MQGRAHTDKKGGHAVRFRTALANNPLQNTLIPGIHEPMAIFGDSVTAQDTHKISGQRAQVEAIMADGYWHTLPNLRTELKRRFGSFYAETAISARIRDLRRAGFTVIARRTRPGSGLYEYRAVKTPIVTLPSAADLDAVAEELKIAEATAHTEAAL